jgi:GTP-dependent phosphoenolpyruvate carboxykinase
LCGTARFTSRQADELVGWFATSDKVRVLKWVRSRMTESAATATSPAAGRPRA